MQRRINDKQELLLTFVSQAANVTGRDDGSHEVKGKLVSLFSGSRSARG